MKGRSLFAMNTKTGKFSSMGDISQQSGNNFGRYVSKSIILCQIFTCKTHNQAKTQKNWRDSFTKPPESTTRSVPTFISNDFDH